MQSQWAAWSALIWCASLAGPLAAAFSAEPFVAFDKARPEQSAIVLQFDAAAGAGYDWAALTQPRVPVGSAAARLRDGVHFLQEGLRRMTGENLAIKSASDISRGLVITLRQHAPPDLRDDPAVEKALKNDGSDAYNDREAFYPPQRARAAADRRQHRGGADRRDAGLARIGRLRGAGNGTALDPRAHRAPPEAGASRSSGRIGPASTCGNWCRRAGSSTASARSRPAPN